MEKSEIVQIMAFIRAMVAQVLEMVFGPAILALKEDLGCKPEHRGTWDRCFDGGNHFHRFFDQIKNGKKHRGKESHFLCAQVYMTLRLLNISPADYAQFEQHSAERGEFGRLETLQVSCCLFKYMHDIVTRKMFNINLAEDMYHITHKIDDVLEHWPELEELEKLGVESVRKEHPHQTLYKIFCQLRAWKGPKP